MSKSRNIGRLYTSGGSYYVLLSSELGYFLLELDGTRATFGGVFATVNEAIDGAEATDCWLDLAKSGKGQE